MKCLVTGGAGFIGSHLVLELINSGHEVLAVDALLDTTYSSQIKRERFKKLFELRSSKLQLIEKDIRFDSLYSEIEECDAIINLAAMPGLNMSWSDFDSYLSCNVTLVERLLQTMIAVGPRKFLHISTSSVYGKFATGDETSNIDPISPYGVTKAAAEMLLKGYQTNFNLEFIILRYFSVYGPGQRPDMAYSKFINSIANGKTIDIYGDGKQVRSNTYISDCIQGTLGALFSKEASGIYNIAGKEQRTVLESISIIESILEKKAQINFMNGVPGDQYKTKGDINKATSAFGFDPVTTLEEGLSHQVSAFKKNSYF